MSHTRLLVLLALSAASLSAAPLVETETAWRFGTPDLALEFAKTTGAWTGLVLGGQALPAVATAAEPCRLRSDDRWLPSEQTPARLVSIQPKDDSTVVTTLGFGDWTVAIEYTLLPETSRIRRRATLFWQGQGEIKLRGFALTAPALAADPAVGQWFSPAAWPPFRRHAAEFAVGSRRSFGRSPVPLVFQYAPGRSLLCVHDLLQPDADNGSVTVQETADGLAISQAFNSLARMQPGTSQSIGDAWLWFVDGDADTALLRFHDLLGDLGCVVPKDRPAWLESAILYSFHPGGTIGSGFRDLGGFVPATAYLDRIADLGCNAIWIMPIEDAAVYHPRDYYKFQEGLGTPEEYRALVARAHELKLDVLQDIVPHGGSNTYPRAKEHPEWLVQEEDGSTLSYWCFDFNWPQWYAYMADVARHYVREYDVDGYRVDACGGSKIPNWNPAIPYSRASHAQLQGGLNMLRALRGAVKETKPVRGAILAESNSDVQGAVSDAIYDFDFCYNVLHGLRKQPAADFVRDLRQWLHEQAAAGPAGLLRLRHIESHDSLRAELWYGLEPQRALMALSAFIPGIPLVYDECENGSRAKFQTMFRLRREFPELNGGTADYLSVPTPPGVFACLRQKGRNRCLVLINFNDTPATFRDGESDLVLAPFAYRILRNGRAYPEPLEIPAAGEALANPAGTVRCGDLGLVLDPATGLPRTAFRNGRQATGAWDLYLPADSLPHVPATMRTNAQGTVTERTYGASTLRLTYTPTGLTTHWDGPVPDGAALAIPLEQAQDWRVVAAEGTFADAYHVRHPAGDGFASSIYWHPQGTNVLWDSLLHPFAADGTGALGSTGLAFQLGFPAIPPRVRWLERVGEDQRLTALVAWDDPQALTRPATDLSLSFSSAPAAKTAVPDLIPSGGGWSLQGLPFSLRIAKNGTIPDFRLAADRPLVSQGDLYTDAGFAPVKERYAAANDVEAYSYFTHTRDSLLASFRGTLRGFSRFDRQGTLVDYAIDYRFAPGNSFRVRMAVRPKGNAGGERAFLALILPTPDLKTFRFEKAGQVIAEGDIGDGSQRAFQIGTMEQPVIPDRIVLGDGTGPLYQLSDLRCGEGDLDNVFAHRTQFFLTFLDTKTPAPVAGRWRWFEATVTPGSLVPTSLAALPPLPPEETPAGLLADAGFETATGQPVSLLTGQMLPGRLAGSAWQVPRGGQLVATPVHSGKQAAEVIGQKSDYRLWTQNVPVDRFAEGSRWRLSAWVKGQDVVAGDISWQVPCLRLAVGLDKTQYVSCPPVLGTFDWQQVTLEWTVPAGLRSLSVQAGQNGSSGTIWFDDVQLERLDP